MGTYPDHHINEKQSLLEIINNTGNSLSEMSSSDIEAVIEKLQKAKHTAKKRENEARLRKKKEARERRAREAEVHVQEVTSMDLPLGWNNVFCTDSRTFGVHFNSIPDALVSSLASLGKVDIEYIACVTGCNYKTVINTLKGSIYQNPDTWGECFFMGWETADEYLSGNLMRKWKAAKEANEEYNGYFMDNLRAIEKVCPPAATADEIYITLGSPWVPPDVIDKFIEHLFGWLDSETDLYKTVHDEITGTWEIPCKHRYWHSVKVTQEYGTDKINALFILEKTLNMKAVVVTDRIDCPGNATGNKRVINKAETIAALEKQQKLIKEFREWVWKDADRKKRLESIFEDHFGCVKSRHFDGSFLQFPNMSPSAILYPYQKDAVARIIFTPNTLLAHDVGAGKTYVMIAAGQELRRMGLSTKNMYVVPNNIVGQWKNIFLAMYPEAKLLCVEPKSFVPNKREDVLHSIMDGDYDGIIIAYSCFEQIPLSRTYYIEELREKEAMISKMVQKQSKATSKLKKKKKAVEKALSELVVVMDDLYDHVYFDDLGITRLFVDEAHNFKNVPIETKANMVLGISANGSKKCRDMMDKVHMVQKKNDGGGVVFATGTPITNSVTDIYIMQMYLQSGELAMLDLQSFDSWIGMFAEKSTEFEIDVDTNNYRMATRFSKFHNLPELTVLLSSVADFHRAEVSAGVPENDGYTDALISKTPEFSTYLDNISMRADAVRQGRISRKDDNMLKITTDGRKAALDMRLVKPNSPFTYQSKVARCAENVAEIYFQTSKEQSTQLIFCDSSTPKAGFNIYDELKTRLVLLGVPNIQIAFIHDADTERKREKLFGKIRSGSLRVLIGSTNKLGLGVNIQNKLIALHHLDVPWRPADMIQREGRIIRQGNENNKVKIYRYITEGSFDAYSWQLLETKQRFITDLLSGSMTERNGADIEDTVLDYAEVKALAVGNPLVKERVEIANELVRYRTLQKKLVESRTALEKELLELPGKIKYQEERIQMCSEDVQLYSDWEKAHRTADKPRSDKEDVAGRKHLRERINHAVRENILKTEDSDLVDYCGFRIILPANMISEKPYVWLEGNGRYYVELGETKTGNLIRIDNFLNHLPDYLDKLKSGLHSLQARESEVKKGLAKKESYSDEIEKYKRMLEKLDRKLGVIKE